MVMSPRCHWCPLDAHGIMGPCPGQARPDLCCWGRAWAEGYGDDDWTLFLLGAGPEPDVRRTRPLAETLQLTRQARECPFRVPPVCGCEASRCTAGRGRDGLVTLPDCWECIDAGVQAHLLERR